MSALTKAQWAYDARLPDDSPSWSESSEWANLHACAVDDLIKRGAVKYCGKQLLDAEVLCIKVQKAAEDAIPGDHECWISQMCVALEADDFDLAKRCMRNLIGPSRIRDIAGELVNEKEDQFYQLHMEANAEDAA